MPANRIRLTTSCLLSPKFPIVYLKTLAALCKRFGFEGTPINLKILKIYGQTPKCERAKAK